MKKLFISLVLGFLSLLITYAETSYTDSLKSLLNDLPEKEHPLIYNKLSLIYLDSSGNAAINYALKSIEISNKHQLEDRLSYAWIMLGSAYLAKSDYKNALETFKESIIYAEKINYPEYLHTIHNNIGVIYRNVSEYELALESFQTALRYARESRDDESIMQTLTNIGNVHAINEKYDEGLRYFLMTAEIGESSPKFIMNLPGVYNNIGWVYQMTEKYSEAMTYYSAAYEIFDSLNINWGKVILLNNMAGVHILENRISEAERLIIMADSLHDSSDLRQSKMNLFQTAYELYESTEQYDKAFEFLKKYYELRDSIHSEDLDYLIHDIRTRYEVDAIKAESELKQLKINQKNILIYALLIILVLIIISSVILVRLNKQKSILNSSLEQSNIEIARKNELINQNLRYASNIQKACMNSLIKPKNYASAYIINLPLNIVGGDFYMFRQKRDSDYVILADCTGHGISGGFLSVLSVQFIDNALTKNEKPNQILEYLNLQFTNYFSVNQGLAGESLSVSVIEITKDKMFFAGSKQKIWTYSKTRNLVEYSSDNLAIGQSSDIAFNSLEIDLTELSGVFLSSDGFPDQFGGKNNKKLKYPAFRKLLEQASQIAFEEQSELLETEFTSWKGDKNQTDDVLIIGIKL